MRARQESSCIGATNASATTIIEYLVDGMGRRAGKKVNGTITKKWLWRSQLQPVAELDANDNVVQRYVYTDGINVPDQIITATATYRLIKDHLGSVRLVVDEATGAVVQKIDYDSWGRVVNDTNPGFQPFGFAGGLYDPDTGLVRFGARDYDPEIGRWVSKDPIRFDGGLNLYEYSRSDPVNYFDPAGRDALAAVLGFFGGAGADAGGAAGLGWIGGSLAAGAPVALLMGTAVWASMQGMQRSTWDVIRDLIEKGRPVPQFASCSWSNSRLSCYTCCKELCYEFAKPGSHDGVCTDGSLDLDPDEWDDCSRACEALQCR